MKLIQILNRHPYVSALVVVTCCVGGLVSAQAAGEERFASKDEAIKALTTAATEKDTNALDTIFGPSVRELASPDPVQASNGLVHFSQRISEKGRPRQ